MWQILLVAAAATSGYLAKRFLDASTCYKKHDQSDQQTRNESSQSLDSKNSRIGSDPLHPSCVVLQSHKDQGGSRVPDVHSSKGGDETKDGVFKFSSVGMRTTRSCGVVGRSLSGRRQQKGKRLSVLSKKHRGWKIQEKKSSELCRDSHFSQGNPLLNWGISMGVMLMASVGKNEMDKLGIALDETEKLIDELKNELHTRKSLRSLHSLSHKCLITPCEEEACKTEKVTTIEKFNAEASDLDETGGFSLVTGENGESESSAITEEPTQRTLEMDELEAELESELEKISWSMFKEMSHSKRSLPKWNEIDVVAHIDELLTHPNPLVEEHEQTYALDLQPGSHIQKLSSRVSLIEGSAPAEIEEHNHKTTTMRMASAGASSIPRKMESVKEDIPILRKKRAIEEDASCQCQVCASVHACEEHISDSDCK